METQFRLYNSINSNFFNLIHGNYETQQTKGLGLLLSKSEKALQAFLKIKAVKDKVGGVDLGNMERLIVNCELTSEITDQRADIVLRFYKKGSPYKVLLIEAKSININSSEKATNKQVSGYISNGVFTELKEFKNEVYGITLTKLPSYLKDDGLISITWSNIIEAFYSIQSTSHSLSNDY